MLLLLVLTAIFRQLLLELVKLGLHTISLLSSLPFILYTIGTAGETRKQVHEFVNTHNFPWKVLWIERSTEYLTCIFETGHFCALWYHSPCLWILQLHFSYPQGHLSLFPQPWPDSTERDNNLIRIPVHPCRCICMCSSTLSLPSSKSTFSQPFKDKYMSEVVRIGTVV